MSTGHSLINRYVKSRYKIRLVKRKKKKLSAILDPAVGILEF